MASETLDLLRSGGEPATGFLPPSSARLAALTVEHDDLDMAIAGLQKAGAHDDLLIARLKKRKLQVKDAMVRALAPPATPVNQGNFSRKNGSGVELTFLVMLAALVVYFWPTADGQNLLASTVLYALLLNSN